MWSGNFKWGVILPQNRFEKPNPFCRSSRHWIWKRLIITNFLLSSSGWYCNQVSVLLWYLWIMRLMSQRNRGLTSRCLIPRVRCKSLLTFYPPNEVFSNCALFIGFLHKVSFGFPFSWRDSSFYHSLRSETFLSIVTWYAQGYRCGSWYKLCWHKVHSIILMWKIWNLIWCIDKDFRIWLGIPSHLFLCATPII